MLEVERLGDEPALAARAAGARRDRRSRRSGSSSPTSRRTRRCVVPRHARPTTRSSDDHDGVERHAGRAPAVERRPRRRPGGPAVGPAPPCRASTSSCAARRDGSATSSAPQFSGEEQPPPPKLPGHRAAASQSDGGDACVPHGAGDERRRPLPGSRLDRAGRRRDAVVATSLGDVDSTLNRLLLIEGLVTSACSRRSGCSASGSSVSACGRWTRSARRRTRSPPATSRSASSARTTHRGRPARDRAEHDARPDRDGFQAREASERGCAASSPTPRTSCARRSRPCARTPSSSRAARHSGPTTSRAR